MAGPPWLIDTSRTPLIVASLEKPSRESPDLDGFLRNCDALLAKKERFVIVVDARFASPDAARRRRTAEWFEGNTESLRRYLVGCGVVAPTAFHRGFLVAIKWLHVPVVPLEGFGDLPQALTWAEGMASKAGLRVPPRAAR